jgi:hypothetical protein
MPAKRNRDHLARLIIIALSLTIILWVLKRQMLPACFPPPYFEVLSAIRYYVNTYYLLFVRKCRRQPVKIDGGRCCQHLHPFESVPMITRSARFQVKCTGRHGLKHASTARAVPMFNLTRGLLLRPIATQGNGGVSLWACIGGCCLDCSQSACC